VSWFWRNERKELRGSESMIGIGSSASVGSKCWANVKSGCWVGLMPGLDVGLGYGCRFSIISCRPVGGTRLDIRVWGWGLGLRSGYPGVN